MNFILTHMRESQYFVGGGVLLVLYTSQVTLYIYLNTQGGQSRF